MEGEELFARSKCIKPKSFLTVFWIFSMFLFRNVGFNHLILKLGHRRVRPLLQINF